MQVPYIIFQEKLARDKARIQQRRNSESGGEEEKSPRKYSLPVPLTMTSGEKNRKGMNEKACEITVKVLNFLHSKYYCNNFKIYTNWPNLLKKKTFEKNLQKMQTELIREQRSFY